jgi:hypothetical protein
MDIDYNLEELAFYDRIKDKKMFIKKIFLSIRRTYE